MLPARYNIQNFIKACKQPSLYAKEFSRLVEKPLEKRIFKMKYGGASDIFDKDWDNLILLDACRYDIYEEECELDGDISYIVSNSSRSTEFIKKTFYNKEHHDTVYVSANPYTERLTDDIFYTIETVYEYYDDETGTVPPKKVVEIAKEASNRYPNKKLLIHFMQPHTPYLGPTGKKFQKKYNLYGWDKFAGLDNRSMKEGKRNTWDAAEDGDIQKPELFKAYRENLRIVLKYTSELMDCLVGKSVISADHGEMLGESRLFRFSSEYGHAANIYTPELRIVPWHVIKNNSRKDVTPESPIGFERVSDHIVKNRLRSLGYV